MPIVQELLSAHNLTGDFFAAVSEHLKELVKALEGPFQISIFHKSRAKNHTFLEGDSKHRCFLSSIQGVYILQEIGLDWVKGGISKGRAGSKYVQALRLLVFAIGGCSNSRIAYQVALSLIQQLMCGTLDKRIVPDPSYKPNNHNHNAGEQFVSFVSAVGCMIRRLDKSHLLILGHNLIVQAKCHFDLDLKVSGERQSEMAANTILWNIISPLVVFDLLHVWLSDSFPELVVVGKLEVPALPNISASVMSKSIIQNAFIVAEIDAVLEYTVRAVAQAMGVVSGVEFSQRIWLDQLFCIWFSEECHPMNKQDASTVINLLNISFICAGDGVRKFAQKMKKQRAVPKLPELIHALHQLAQHIAKEKLIVDWHEFSVDLAKNVAECWEEGASTARSRSWVDHTRDDFPEGLSNPSQVFVRALVTLAVAFSWVVKSRKDPRETAMRCLQMAEQRWRKEIVDCKMNTLDDFAEFVIRMPRISVFMKVMSEVEQRQLPGSGHQFTYFVDPFFDNDPERTKLRDEVEFVGISALAMSAPNNLQHPNTTTNNVSVIYSTKGVKEGRNLVQAASNDANHLFLCAGDRFMPFALFPFRFRNRDCGGHVFEWRARLSGIHTAPILSTIFPTWSSVVEEPKIAHSSMQTPITPWFGSTPNTSIGVADFLIPSRAGNFHDSLAYILTMFVFIFVFFLFFVFFSCILFVLVAPLLPSTYSNSVGLSRALLFHAIRKRGSS